MAVDLLNVKGLKEADPAGPIVMVNLMRFRARSLDGDGSGWDAILGFASEPTAAPFPERVRCRVLLQPMPGWFPPGRCGR